jgi:hypothetical protein
VGDVQSVDTHDDDISSKCPRSSPHSSHDPQAKPRGSTLHKTGHAHTHTPNTRLAAVRGGLRWLSGVSPRPATITTGASTAAPARSNVVCRSSSRKNGSNNSSRRRPRQGLKPLPLPLPLRTDARRHSSGVLTLRGIKPPSALYAYASGRLVEFCSSSSSSASPEVTHSSSSSPSVSAEELLAGGEPGPPGESECCGNGKFLRGLYARREREEKRKQRL